MKKKDEWERKVRRTNFVIFVVKSALIVGGWVLVAWHEAECLI